MIFKVQRSLSPGPSRVLVYNKTRSIIGEFPMDVPVRNLFFENGNPPKLYVQGKIDDSTGQIKIDHVIKNRNW